METTNLGKSIKEIFDGQYKYVVPLYQRNFAWRQEHIERLLQDVYEAYKENYKGYYFIGSLVVLKRSNGDFEVIDGQQRLTTLSLITKIMGINEEPRLFYDSRPEVEEFFKAFYKSENAECHIDYPQTFHLRNAIDYIKDAKLDAKENCITIDSVEEDFKSYFANNVILVRVEIPQDTDVASYFEIMNNRGEQLQKHEILKSLMMSNLDTSKRNEFARIWDACSQMDIPIQKSFKAGSKESIGTRNHYFDDNYDGFCFQKLAELTLSSDSEKSQNDNEGITIDDIIDENKTVESVGNDLTDDEEYISESQYKSIIDFPNFLMHVFKIMFPQEEIPLNEKFLLSKYKELEDCVKPEDFIVKLLFCRTVYDRYILKSTVDDKDTEDGEKWVLIKPKKYEKSWKFVDTFGKDDAGNTTKEQNRIVKALSMLQVTFRTRIYKNWLYEVLKWFDSEIKSIVVPFEDYAKKLDGIISNYYDDLCKKIVEEEEKKKNNIVFFDNDAQLGIYKKIEVDLTHDNSYSYGTNTPHYLFNYIDYLYWIDSQNDNSIFDSKKELKDFEFKYWNSVEHHLAQQYAKDKDKDNYEDYINNLGNLCLISKNANSRLNDRAVQEKVERTSGNMGPNRQIIYKQTKNSDGTYTWDKDKIKKHYNELLKLLSNSRNILGLTIE